MRHSTVKAWRDLLYQVVNEQDVEDKYFELLRESDRMKKAGFINEDEWRKLVRKAGEFLANNVE